eukprot:PhF_6_TR20010/c0_g1_i8/m.29219/K07359/CAMKK2; calcium/calmodulin-dependent protein kinase kinase 2
MGNCSTTKRNQLPQDNNRGSHNPPIPPPQQQQQQPLPNPVNPPNHHSPKMPTAPLVNFSSAFLPLQATNTTVNDASQSQVHPDNSQSNSMIHSGEAVTIPGCLESRSSLEVTTTTKDNVEDNTGLVQLSNVSVDNNMDSNDRHSDTQSDTMPVSLQLDNTTSLIQTFSADGPYDVSENEGETRAAIPPPLPNFVGTQNVVKDETTTAAKKFATSMVAESTLESPEDSPTDPSSSSVAQSTNELVRGVDADGNKLLNEYSVVATIGQGNFGKVKLAVDSVKGTSVAIKILNKARLEKQSRLLESGVTPTPLELVHQEIAIMRACRHPCLVKLINVIKDPTAPKLYIVMEYMEGGAIGQTPTLIQNKTLTPTPCVDVRHLRLHMHDLAFGLQCLHNKGVIHMDIKPENILRGKDEFGQETCKLADFGVCTVLSESFATNTDHPDVVHGLQGTPLFFAPEMIEGTNGFHGKATDVWALGVTWYLLAYGCLPFAGDTLPMYHEQVRTREPSYPTFNGAIPTHFVNLIQSMLQKEPDARITMPEIVGHPFFLSNRFDRVPLKWWTRCWKLSKK